MAKALYSRDFCVLGIVCFVRIILHILKLRSRDKLFADNMWAILKGPMFVGLHEWSEISIYHSIIFTIC